MSSEKERGRVSVCVRVCGCMDVCVCVIEREREIVQGVDNLVNVYFVRSNLSQNVNKMV